MKKILVFSGAGLSADSGIPTFRDSNGLWENYKPEDVAEYDAWWRNKELVLNFYKERYEKYSVCEHHEGHKALAKLEEKFDVTHVTQNIDFLLEEAGCTNILHLHGTIGRKKCEYHKDIATSTSPHKNKHTCDYKANSDGPIEIGDLCPKCNSQMRPDIVWFNEAVNINQDIILNWVHEIKYNDGIFISVGTSAQVYPAAFLISYFSQVKNKYIVDPKPQTVGDYTLIEGTAKEKLPELVETLMKEE